MFVMLPCIPDMHRECSPGFRNQEYKRLQALANRLVPVLVPVVMAPLKIIFLLGTRGFREITISLVILCQVLVVHLVFILVPLVVVTSVFVVIPLALVVWMVIVSSHRDRAGQRCTDEECGQVSIHVVFLLQSVP